jgi:hypothetical protein
MEARVVLASSKLWMLSRCTFNNAGGRSAAIMQRDLNVVWQARSEEDQKAESHGMGTVLYMALHEKCCEKGGALTGLSKAGFGFIRCRIAASPLLVATGCVGSLIRPSNEQVIFFLTSVKVLSLFCLGSGPRRTRESLAHSRTQSCLN